MSLADDKKALRAIAESKEWRNPYAAQLTRILDALDEAERALEVLINKVSESLLLDDQLADAWDELHSSVVEARAALAKNELPFPGANNKDCDNPNGPCFCGAWHKSSGE